MCYTGHVLLVNVLTRFSPILGSVVKGGARGSVEELRYGPSVQARIDDGDEANQAQAATTPKTNLQVNMTVSRR